MADEFEVQKAGLAGQNWTVVYRGHEHKAREIFRRQLHLYSVGRFRLLAPDRRVIEEGKASPLFSKELARRLPPHRAVPPNVRPERRGRTLSAEG
jgi:hypothetical protein